MYCKVYMDIATKLEMLILKSKLKNIYIEVKSWVGFIYKTLSSLHYAFRYPGETSKQFYIMGVQAIIIVLLATSFTSMVLALEWAKKLEPFGAKLMLGRIVAVSVIREIGPMLTGLMVAGRSGAKVVSEIGNMALTEQIDALHAFGVDPIKRLVVPRVFASIMIMIPLTLLADAMGIIASWFASVVWMGVDSQFFWISMRDGLFIKDLVIGWVKPPFYGVLIGIISSYYGYTVQGGAEGMGRAATKTVMYSSLAVLFMDFLLTKIILSLY